MKELTRPLRGLASRFEFSITFNPISCPLFKISDFMLKGSCLAWLDTGRLGKNGVIKPSVQTVAKIAKALGGPMEDLLE